MDETDSWYLKEKQRTWRTKLDTIKARLAVKTGEFMAEGIQKIKLGHGLKLISSTKLFEEYLDVCYCDDIQEYFILDSALKIHRYSIQGRFIPHSYTLSSNMVFTKIVWCTGIKILACYIPDDDLMWILTPEYQSSGPLWTIQYSSLISTNPSSLKVVGSYLTTIYIIPLDHNEDEDIGTPVEFLAKKINASVSAITALYFYSTSQWIIVGDQQGNGWNLNLERVLRCLQGHKDAVKIITFHPSICGFITSSEDNNLQVWSCNLRRKMESFSELGAISSITVNKTTSSIATIGEKLSFFHMHQLYVFFSPLTATARILFSTINYIHPTRTIVCSSDGVVSMLSSLGSQLSITVLPSRFISLSMAYSAVTGNLYLVSSKTGEILINDTTKIPMEFRNSCSSEEKITCIAVYDYFEEINEFNRNARIIIGTNTGDLMSFEETTGKYKHMIKAHEGSIKKIYPSTVSRHIFSIGEDKCLKIWRILLHIETFLVLMNYIYYTIPITDLASMEFIVCIVSSTENFPIHQLFMYDIKEKMNLYHSASQDHGEEILGITTSESLSICATSSKDNTIRIWDKQNSLLKILEVNISVKEITFSSLRGDIVFSAGKHLYRLPYGNYLPLEYRNILRANDIPEEKEEGPMPRHYDYNKFEEDENKRKALYPVSSIPLGSLDPSSDIPHLDLIIQQQMCMQLKFRDEDILKIKKSSIRREKKLSTRKASMSSDEWRKYMNNLLGISSKAVEDIIPPHNIWKIKEKYTNIKKISHKATFIPTYFEYNIQKISEDAELLEKIVPKNFIGFIPNSLIVETQSKNEKQSKFVDKMELENKNLFAVWLLEGFSELLK